MKRRDFVALGLSAVAAGASGCASINPVVIPSSPKVTPAEMEQFLIAHDGMMARIGTTPGAGKLLREFVGDRSITENVARLYRQTMRSLYLLGNFGDLSTMGQVHPGVQKRLQYSDSEIEAAFSGALDRIVSMSPTARADLQAALRADPTLGERILQSIDLDAAEAGAPDRRRQQLKIIGEYAVTRLTHSSEVFLDEYVSKHEKLSSRSGSVAETHRLIGARIGRVAFRARLREAEMGVRAWRRVDPQEIPIGYVLEATGDLAELAEGQAGRRSSWGLRWLKRGAILTAGGWVLIGLGRGFNPDAPKSVLVVPGVVLGITVGPLMMAVSLIALAVTGISRSISQ